MFKGGKQKSNQSSAGQQYNSGQNYGSNIGTNFAINQSGSSGNSFNQSTSNQGSNSVSGSMQDVWGSQSPFLESMYGSAQGEYGNALNNINGMTPQVSGQVQDAFGTGSGAFNNLAVGGQQAQLLSGMGQNPYVAAMKDQVASDADRLKQQTLASTDARAAAAGMSGSSGYRDQVGQSFSNIDQQAMDAMSNIGYNSFNQDMQNRMSLAQGIDANMANAMGNTGAMQGAAVNQFNPFMAGLNATNQYAGILGGPTVLGNSFSNSSSYGNSSSIGAGTNNSFSNGMNVGLDVGGNIGNNQGWGNNSGTGSSSGWNIGMEFQPPAGAGL